MGGEYATPGKSSATQVASTSSASANDLAPGKSTQVDRTYGLYGAGAQTGNAGVDNAGKGKETTRGDNFLTDQQRPILIAEYIGRVNAAHAAYLSALVDLHIEKVTEKEEEFPIVGMLLLAAGGKAAEAVLRGACALLRRGGQAAAQLAEAGVQGVTHEAEGKMLGLSEKSVEFIISTATDQAKDKIKGSAAKALGAEQATAKGQALSFIDYMRDASMTLFQRFREEPIGRVSDAQLLALFTSFEGSRHTPTLYRLGCDSYLRKYMASHAKDIGHKEEFGVKAGRMAESRTETRVANIRVGNTVRKGYIQTELDNAFGGGVPSSAALDAPDHAIGMQEAGVETEEPRFLGWVEPELEDVATATHEQRWLQAPATYTLNLPSMNLTKGTP